LEVARDAVQSKETLVVSVGESNAKVLLETAPSLGEGNELDLGVADGIPLAKHRTQ
jgi:hypothetical protein